MKTKDKSNATASFDTLTLGSFSKDTTTADEIKYEIEELVILRLKPEVF